MQFQEKLQELAPAGLAERSPDTAAGGEANAETGRR